jgi:L-serine dehydratase
MTIKWICEESGVHRTEDRRFEVQEIVARGTGLTAWRVFCELAGIEFVIPADEVIDTMGEIGRDMDVRYRETAGGGLAATPTGRRLAKERLVQIKRG